MLPSMNIDNGTEAAIQAKRQAYLDELYAQAISVGDTDLVDYARSELSLIALGGNKYARELIDRMDALILGNRKGRENGIA